MTAATLSLDYFYHIVAKNEIELFTERHRNRHISKNIP